MRTAIIHRFLLFLQIPNRPPQVTVENGLLSDREYRLSVEILVLGVLVILAEFILLRSIKIRTGDVLRTFTVTLIILGMLLLITAGYGDRQIAPAAGLFGTIAGYILGRRDPTITRTEKEESDR